MTVKAKLEAHRQTVVIASADHVRSVLKRMTRHESPTSFSKACAQCHITEDAFWRRALKDPVLKREIAFTLISRAWNRADEASANETPGALNVFAKLSREMAASLAPQDWGEKVQVDQRQLIINCNLDFSLGGEQTLEDAVRDITVIADEENDDR